MLDEEFRKRIADTRMDYSRQRRVSRFLALLLRSFQQFTRVARRIRQSQETLPVIVSNIFLVLEALALFRYVITFFAFSAASPHLARRLHVIDSEHSNLFVRPLRFLLTTGTVLALIVWIAGDRLPSALTHLLPEKEWQRAIVLTAFALSSPLFLAALALLVKLPILLGAFIIPDKRLKDPEIWWAIPFLCDPRTWKKFRTPEVYQYLLYAGPYAILMSSLIACVALWPLPTLERFSEDNPGRLSPEGSVLIFRLIWAAAWGLYADILVVNRFTAGLPMVMSAPTYALTRMVNPRLYQYVVRLRKLVAVLKRSRSPHETLGVLQAGGAAEILIELEFGAFVYRLLLFPFRIDFLELYALTDPMDVLADVFVDGLEPHAMIMRVREVLQGTGQSIFEQR